jgi:hypothetical protein
MHCEEDTPIILAGQIASSSHYIHREVGNSRVNFTDGFLSIIDRVTSREVMSIDQSFPMEVNTIAQIIETEGASIESGLETSSASHHSA